MASTPKRSVRLRPIIHAYLGDLAKLGAYGRGRWRDAPVYRVANALEKKVIAARDAAEFGEEEESESEEED